MIATTFPETEERTFTPGTTGWSAKDLLDPEIERLWEMGSYEIVEGVLTIVPPAQFASSSSLLNLLFVVTTTASRVSSALRPITSSPHTAWPVRTHCY